MKPVDGTISFLTPLASSIIKCSSLTPCKIDSDDISCIKLVQTGSCFGNMVNGMPYIIHKQETCCYPDGRIVCVTKIENYNAVNTVAEEKVLPEIMKRMHGNVASFLASDRLTESSFYDDCSYSVLVCFADGHTQEFDGRLEIDEEYLIDHILHIADSQ